MFTVPDIALDKGGAPGWISLLCRHKSNVCVAIHSLLELLHIPNCILLYSPFEPFILEKTMAINIIVIGIISSLSSIYHRYLGMQALIMNSHVYEKLSNE